MSIRVIASAALTGLLVAGLAVAAAAAPRDIAPPSKLALDADGSAGIASYFFGTGFESGEGFVLGPLEPQAGWTASGVNLPFASISNATPFTGLQHLRMIKDPTVASGTNRVALSPVQATPANTPSTVYVKVRISNDGGSDYDVVGQAPSQGFLSWRVKFSWSGDTGAEPGTIYVLDDPGTGLAFQNTNTLWTEGVYKELRVDFDPAANVSRYYYDGVLIFTGTVYAGTAVEQMVFLHDNYQLTGETGDFDALSVQTLGEPPVAVEPRTWSQIKAMMR